jgi:uncharacterized membrane protein
MRWDIVPEWLRRGIDTIESAEQVDAAVTALAPQAERLASGPAGPALSGQWLGHALHPLATDLPLGCWISSGLLDLVGGSRSRRASQRLVGLGLVFVPLTAASGLVDWSAVDEPGTKRVGAVHAVGNTIVASLYFMSWRSRRRGHHVRGVTLGLTAGSLAWATGYLGGHMSFGRGAGVGERGLDGGASGGQGGDSTITFVEIDVESVDDEPVDARRAAEMLTVGLEQLQALVDGGLLVPASGQGEHALFRRNDVLAARSVGG